MKRDPSLFQWGKPERLVLDMTEEQAKQALCEAIILIESLAGLTQRHVAEVDKALKRRNITTIIR